MVSVGDFKEEHFIIDPNHLQAEKEKTTHVRLVFYAEKFAEFLLSHRYHNSSWKLECCLFKSVSFLLG